MVDIVNSTNAFTKVEEVRNRSDNIIDSDVLWNEVVSLKFDVLLKLFLILRILKNFLESLERYLFVDAKLSAVKINIAVISVSFINELHMVSTIGITKKITNINATNVFVPILVILLIDFFFIILPHPFRIYFLLQKECL